MRDLGDLGDLGELYFNAWCSEIDLIANKSTKDKMGWDFIVEFPFSNKISGLQIHQSAPKCKVQVKATDGQERKLSVKLSNLRKLAVDPLPCFYIFIEFDGSNSPVRAFLRHMDEELIEKILEIVSTTDNKTFTVRYDDTHILNELTGKCLAEKIESYIGKDLADYVNYKKSFLENVGYGEDRFKIKFDLIGKKNLEEMIDVNLGLVDKVRISNFSAVEKRFGIPHVNPALSSGTAEVSMPSLKPTTKAKMIFRKGSISNDYRFDVDVYFPHFLNDFNHPLFKSRYTTNFFDLTLKHNSKTLDFKFNFGVKPFSLRDLRNSLKFITEISSGESFKILLKGENGQEILGTINSDGKSVDYSNNIDTLNSLIRITQLFDITKEVLMSFDEIDYLEASTSPMLDFFQKKTEQFKISFNLDDETIDIEEEIVILGAIVFRIGDVVLYTFYSAKGAIVNNKETEHDFEMYAPKVNILNKTTTSICSPLTKDDLHDELCSYQSDFFEKQVVILRDKLE